MPSHLLPTRAKSPFPADYYTHKIKRAEKMVTFLLVVSKARVSSLAVERNRARRKLKTALDLVINRGIGLETPNGQELVLSSTPALLILVDVY